LGLWDDGGAYKNAEYPTSMFGGTKVGDEALAEIPCATGLGQYAVTAMEDGHSDLPAINQT